MLLCLTSCSYTPSLMECPKTAVISDFSRYPTSSSEAISLRSVYSVCSLDGQNVDVQLTLDILHSSTIKPTKLPYFVALVEKNTNVLMRKDYLLTLSTLHFQFVKDANKDPSDYTIYIGFSLTEEQLRYEKYLKQQKELCYQQELTPLDIKRLRLQKL